MNHLYVETATASKCTTSTGTGSGPTPEIALQAAIKAANDALNLPTEQSRYANIVSSIPGPVQSLVKEYIYFDECDSEFWKIGSDKRDLICLQSGFWTLLANYQLVGIGDGLAKLHGWFNVNDVDIKKSDCCGSSVIKGNDSIMLVSYNIYLNVGDIVRCGVFSTDVNKIVCKSTLNPPPGLECPGIIFTATKFSN